MMLLHWNRSVDYTHMSAEGYKAANLDDSILFPLYPNHLVRCLNVNGDRGKTSDARWTWLQDWFMRKPLAEEEKDLLVVCDPTGQRTLGEREAYLRAHPDHTWGKTRGSKDFYLVHQDKEEGIYHYGGALLRNSSEPTVEICFSFDTTGSMYPYLQQVRKNLKYLVQSLLLDVPSLRISIIAHGDYSDQACGRYGMAFSCHRPIS